VVIYLNLSPKDGLVLW